MKDIHFCESCEFWKQVHNWLGECRRDSPICGRTHAAWPETMVDDWCGEWIPTKGFLTKAGCKSVVEYFESLDG